MGVVDLPPMRKIIKWNFPVRNIIESTSINPKILRLLASVFFKENINTIKKA
jgi:hypothetical protein